MILNKEVTFVTKVQSETSDKPWDHDEPTVTENKIVYSVNVTSMDNDRMIRDYGVSDANIQVIRSLTPLSAFDYILIDGVKYVANGSQAIDNKRSIIVKEADK